MYGDELRGRRSPVELSNDRAFSRRVIRLAITSAVILGLVWRVADATLQTHAWVGAALLSGWILMPSILVLSLRWPRLRYALILPSTLVAGALLAITVMARPPGTAASVGWLLITVGVLEGAVLGLWFWFRWAPVPPVLDRPFSGGRWLLILLHVTPIVVGLALAGWPLVGASR